MNKKVLQVTVQEPKIKTIKLLGQDVQVKDYIPYEEKREMVEKIVYGGYYSNGDLGVSGTLPIYPAVKVLLYNTCIIQMRKFRLSKPKRHTRSVVRTVRKQNSMLASKTIWKL